MMEVFAEIGAKDPHFTYKIQADNEGGINNLMWASENSKLQYTFFRDVITFDTMYWTNLYEMMFRLLLVLIVISRVPSWQRCLFVMRQLRVLNVFSEFLRVMGGAPLMTILTGKFLLSWCVLHTLFRLWSWLSKSIMPDTTCWRCKCHMLKNAK